jgi:hypothetical protein
MPTPEALGLGLGDQRLDQAVEHDLKDGQRQEGACQAVGRAGEKAAAEASDMFQGGVAVQNLEDEPVDDRDGVEEALTPGVPGLAARGLDGIGFEAVSDILPQLLQDGINLVMHQGASLCDGVVKQRHRARRPFSSQALASPEFILSLVPFPTVSVIVHGPGRP